MVLHHKPQAALTQTDDRRNGEREEERRVCREERLQIIYVDDRPQE